ncbi:hypothetical protein EH30_12965 [Erythrobacter sp. JL475]|nr:hypothetical protein EH30_12965 [Erythrobacter sp. JL475]
MDLKFVAAQKPKAQNPITLRRQRLSDRIDQQIALLSGASVGSLPSKSWVWIDNDGACLLSIKYARQVLELKKGMFSIKCNNLDEVAEAFTQMKQSILRGDLDQQISSASTEIRSKFLKRQKPTD